MNFRLTFTFCVEKSYDGTHLAFGGTFDRRCRFKHVSLKQSRLYHCQTSAAHRYRIKVDGNVAIISKKISLSAYTWCSFTFRIRLAIIPGIKVNAGMYKIKNDCLVLIILFFERALFLINWQHIFLSINYINFMTFEVSNQPTSKTYPEFSPLSSTVHFNIISPLAPKSFKEFVPSSFPTKFLVYFPSSPWQMLILRPAYLFSMIQSLESPSLNTGLP